MVFEEHADKIKASYKKMAKGNAKAVKNDPYHKYFYNLVDTARNYADFSYVRLVKFVDEKWVNEIEEALPSLIKVVQNPRKFIEEEREVVNIAMARNISAESVRHLLAHSNYIDEYRKDGTVIPNKILNVYKEESLNTYENRFICTLIAELQFFVNRRYHAIFDASKDEMGVNFEVGSTIDNYTEAIDYKLKITIRDKQTEEDNKDENKAVFARIADIYKKVNMLTTTEFVATMRKFPAVQHPIVKTNAIAKNQDYKACHKLWNFIHTYTQVGYKVDMLKQDPNVSGQLKRDIYNSIVWHYAMLHNYMDDVDELQLDRERRKKQMDIPEMRGLLEQIVDGMEMPDERLRNLLLNELVTIQRRKTQEREAAEKTAKEIRDKRESARLYELQQEVERQRYEDDMWDEIMFGGLEDEADEEDVFEEAWDEEDDIEDVSDASMEDVSTEDESVAEVAISEEGILEEVKEVTGEVEEPNEASVEEPNEVVVEDSDKADVEESKEEVVEEPDEADVEEPNEASVEEPNEAGVEEPNEAIAEESNEAVGGDSDEADAEEPNEAVAEESKEVVVEEPVEAVVEEPSEAVGEESNEPLVEKMAVEEPKVEEQSPKKLARQGDLDAKIAQRKKADKEFALQIIEAMLDDIDKKRRR